MSGPPAGVEPSGLARKMCTVERLGWSRGGVSFMAKSEPGWGLDTTLDRTLGQERDHDD